MARSSHTATCANTPGHGDTRKDTMRPTTMIRVRLLLTAFALIGILLGVAGAIIMIADDARATGRPCPATQTQRHPRPCKPCPTTSATPSASASTSPTPTVDPETGDAGTTDGKGPYRRTRPTCPPSSTPPTTAPTSNPPTTRPTPSTSTSPTPTDPTPTATAPPPPGDTLPLTGASAGAAAGIAATLVLAGLVLLYTARRRRTRYIA